MNLIYLEKSLKLRLNTPYVWGRKQNNNWDSKTQFIYSCRSYDELKSKLLGLDPDLYNYALNRRYNFWSAMGVEQIFCSYENVIAHKNSFNRLVDFHIDGIAFDHKTTVFPKGFQHNFDYAVNNKIELIQWLYENQSQQSRKHLKNRIFIVLYDANTGDHWKLKSEIALLQKYIDNYMVNFDKNNLIKLDFGEGEILSDIIWVCS